MKTLFNRTALASAILSCAGALCSTFAFAKDADTLDTIVVTASRIAQTEDETLASVTVITREDIERLQIQTLAEALNRVPGLSIASNGGRGQTTSVFTRGTESNQTLFLVDGVKLREASFGGIPLEHIPLNQIERIEVVRGPRAALYGSEAVGGVIQVFTRQASTSNQPFASITAGRYGHTSANAGFSGGTDATRYTVSVGGEETDGYDVRQGGSDDDDSIRTLNGSFRLNHRITEKAEINLSALHNESDIEFDDGTSDTRVQTLVAKAKVTPTQTLAIDGSVERSRLRTEFPTFDFASETVNDSANLNITYDASDSLTLLWGGEYQDEERSSTFLDPTSRIARATYGQAAAEFGPVETQLSLRRDLYDDGQDANTGSFALGYQLTPNTRITSEYGEAFIIPTVQDRTGNPAFGQPANPNIRPESAKNYQIGMDYRRSSFKLSLTAYHTKVFDLITADSENRSVNLDRARNRGGELTVGISQANWAINWALARVDAIDDDTGEELVRRPKYTSQLDFDHFFGRYSAGFSVKNVSSTAEINNQQLGSYGLVDVRGSFKLSPAWTVQALISNIGDKFYQTASGFREPGSAGYLTFKYQPQ